MPSDGPAPRPGASADDGRRAKLPEFTDAGLLDILDGLPVGAFDGLEFGLVTMTRDGTVIGYNAEESQLSGLSPERVIGRHFFSDVGPCTDNPIVAGRYGPEDRLDHRMNYVFTFHMQVTPVELRLMAAAGSPRQYLAIRTR